ncbi:hypothetical protein Lal_00045296 [Lupinus albus]|nr:hypothetical protein Lal_00045296 [Lupinus albus]
MFNPVPVGKRIRYSYAKINEVLDMPNLIELQKNSYNWFLKEGLQEIFRDISPIQDFTGNLVLSFENFTLGEPKYHVEECKERDVTYSAPLRVNVRLINRETGEIKEQEVFMGDFPLMTTNGTFIINGAERVIVSQLVRSPGVYYGETIDTTGKKLYNATVIPNRGAWLELETDANDVISVRVDRTRKLPVTVLIRALGWASNGSILELFYDDTRVRATLERDSTDSKEEALVEIYKRLRPGEPPTVENATQLLESLFFDPKRYDLATVGRYKLTKKLGWKRRLMGKTLHQPLVDTTTGEIIVADGTVLDEKALLRIEESGIFAQPGLVEALINIRPVVAAIKEFFGSSQLSQFMDQTNPLAELTHKRRLSALGPGGLSRERAGFEVRDVHHSHYGRMCPIETPEVDKYNKKVSEEVYYVTADEEDEMIIAQANEALTDDGWFKEARVTVRYKHDILNVPPEQVDYMDVSPKQVVSIATAMIPFLENDDANRALMGANMQRQAVPLLRTQAPLVGTGMEYKAARDSGVVILAKNAGRVERVSATEIHIRTDNGGLDSYKMLKYIRSNQGTCINQKPIVYKNERIEKGQVLADGPSTDRGELALGFNVLVAFMPWEGYNYEDAILLSEKLVKEDVFTSIHIEEYECDARDTKLGPEEITRDIPNVAEDVLRDLDDRGIIRIGAEVRPGDILVGKVTPKGETELTAEERLLRAIFGEKAREVRDTSLRVPHGEAGKIVDVKVFSRENGDELPPGVNQLVRVYIAQKRKISEGDKMAGRHGNKGVVSRIMRQEDMPFMPDGTPVQIVLNPLGVPSRMNIGQVLETHLGWAASALGMQIQNKDPEVENRLKMFNYNFDKNGMPEPDIAGIHLATPVFDGAREHEVFHTLEAAGLPADGKTVFSRVKTYEAIVKGENVPEPGVPESFKVLIKELQSIGLDVKVLTEDAQEILIRESDEDIHETAKELELSLGGEEARPSPHERTRTELESDMVDELESGDNLEPLEEELDIIAEIGDMDNDKFDAAESELDSDEEFVPARLKAGAKKNKLKDGLQKKINPREYLDDLEDDFE